MQLMNPPNILDTITYYQRNISDFKWIDISEAHYVTLFLYRLTFFAHQVSYLCVYMDIHQIQKHFLAHHVTFILEDIYINIRFRDISLCICGQTFP